MQILGLPGPERSLGLHEALGSWFFVRPYRELWLSRVIQGSLKSKVKLSSFPCNSDVFGTLSFGT